MAIQNQRSTVCIGCRAAVPAGAFRCPECGLVQVEGEDLETHESLRRDAERAKAVSAAAVGIVRKDEIADPFERLFAFIIDALIIIGISIGVGFTFGLEPGEYARTNLEYNAFYTILFLVFLGYYWVLEALPVHATVGKLVFGMQVVDEWGEGIGLGKSFMRNVLGRIPGWIMPLVYILIIGTERTQGLHDKIAGTYVIDR